MPPEQYVGLVRKEIQTRSASVQDALRAQNSAPTEMQTIYFGGGTPSLLEPELIVSIIQELANHGWRKSSDIEITVEINPGTVDERKLDAYLEMGVNRFSVGAQSFHDHHLKKSGRKHNAQDTVDTLTLLKSRKINYSFDLLFALPTQTLAEVSEDMAKALEFDPAHLSAYCLTVPESHPMAKGRAPEDEQVQMFDTIETQLAAAGFERYEISNFAKPGFESRHNRLYWSDQDYWGIGVSSHSYLKAKPWGKRFWNPFSLKAYEKQISNQSHDGWDLSELPASDVENLKVHQILSDYCHTFLRVKSGLNMNALRLKFSESVATEVSKRLHQLQSEELVANMGGSWALTRRGRLIANKVFETLTFLESDGISPAS